MALISAGLIFLLWGKAHSDPTSQSFDRITVHRIDVIEPDGKPRMIISDKPEMPGIIWDGKEYHHATRNEGGVLFFDDDGTEAGGMTWSNARKDGHYGASSGILFDQYHQDQTLGLQYREEDGKRAAGLEVWDRPDESLLPAVELNDRYVNAKTPEEKAAVKAEMAALSARWKEHYAERVFAGKQTGDALVRLNDAHGKPRLVMKVAADGHPVVQFLDADGKVTKEITDK
jgi:hypothetical protein